LDQVLPADMKFENTPIAQVAERLSKATGFEITLSADTKPAQTFSADLSNRPFSAAMTAISQQLKGSMICIIRMSRDDTGKLMLISFRIGSAAGPAKRD
jgi:5-enolpyruvylshikimate-3-phosphate synthase